MRSRPRKAVPPRLTRGMSAAEAWREIARACLKQIRGNEAAALDGRDAEGLHQFRIGWARLRCALSMPRDPGWRAALGALRPELRWLSHELGAARNWDVLVPELTDPAGRFATTRPHQLAAFRARCAGLARDRHASVRRALRSGRYRRLLLDVGELIAAMESTVPGVATGKARRFAEAVLERRRRKLVRKGTRPGSVISADERHRIRIAAKKLRYASELFRGLFSGRKVERYCRRLERLQDVLGRLNDLANGTRMAAEAAARAGRSGARVAKVVQCSLRAQARDELRPLDNAWSRLVRKKPFW